MPSTSVSTTAKRSLLSLLFLLVLLICVACGENSPTEPTTEAEQTLALDMTSPTAKAEATVKAYVDGDTVHFGVSEDVFPDGLVKIRFLGINTPESTGKVEPYGKKASQYTKDALSAASAIVLESDSDSWQLDSTGSRYLGWVWYKTEDSQEYRNLNVELLEQGLARITGISGIRYGSYCSAALSQAQEQKRNLYSGQPDPDFAYDEILELTLKELSQDPQAYEGKRVQVTGTITGSSGSNGVYLEWQDPETAEVYGFYVYYGFNLPAPALEALAVGNQSRLTGIVQFYEGSGSWQLSGLTYNWTDRESPENPVILAKDQSPVYSQLEENAITEQTLYTSVTLQGLTIEDAATQGNQLILRCKGEEREITLCCPALQDAAPDTLPGKQVDGKGIVISVVDPIKIHVIRGTDLTIY